MIERIFVMPNVMSLVALGVAGFILGLIVGMIKDQGGDSALRGLEALVLTFIGGFLASAFISLLIGLDHDSREACLFVGWGFFLIPGIVDTIPYFLGKQLLTAPDTLIMLAAIVGGITGMMGGIWRVYNWLGLGWLSFPLDVTWALAGSNIGCLLHLINFAWGRHAGSVDNETRENAHHYRSGFGLKSGFAFTQGPVMSNLNYSAGDDLYRHEKTHVWQN